MKKLLLVLFTTIFIAVLNAQMTNPLSGKSFGNGSLAGADQAWVNTFNVAATDNQYASFDNLPDVAGSHTDYLITADFGFEIPASFRITGIKVYVENSDPSNCTSDYSVRIMKNGVIGETDHSSGALYSNSDSSSQIYGGASDLWGESWVPADVNAKDFGVAIAAQRAVTGKTTDARIDNIRIIVFYIDPNSLPAFTLPLTLVSFTAINKNDMVRIEWKTADESSMDRFEIQRSPDGSIFQSFGTLMCRNQAVTALYSFNDNAPFRGISYYRLKILERSGSVTYSKIAVVEYKTDNPATLFPSPWKKGQPLFVRNPGNEDLTIQFYNANGDVVAKVNTFSAAVAMPESPAITGILRYKVFDDKGKVVGFGSLPVY